ncbi:TFIIB-type zinc finger domain-containing protein [Floricoccus penangensis]|uniref:TFIIB-type zinc finger domain-containing protein n=1 Tax=Floricoccus penangensis TaxID=1859475 RepID=UPI002042646C|nr:TFIIB-type zinc finger domain-containing protein [Floricoccus penangensis]URZ86719.1 hypothetical protein KIW23_06390 [Floricoccus penangensis]
MKNKECRNCGSTQFHEKDGIWYCDYCKTPYPIPIIEESKSVEFSPIKNKVFIPKSIAIFLLTTISVSFFILEKKYNLKDTETIDTAPSTHINLGIGESSERKFPRKWTQEIYDDIRIARQKYDSKTGKYIFDGGDNYKDLKKIVGAPSNKEVQRADYGYPERIYATWNKSEDNTLSKAIYITYDAKTFMILDKSIF